MKTYYVLIKASEILKAKLYSNNKNSYCEEDDGLWLTDVVLWA